MAGVIAHVRFTVELKPPEGVIVTVDVAESPGVMVAGVNGVAVSANGGAAVTVRLTVVVWTRVPDVPVIVKLKLPSAEDACVEIVNVDVAGVEPGVTDCGDNVQVASGSAEQEKAITLVNAPLCGVTVTVFVACPPCVTVMLELPTLSEKSGAELELPASSRIGLSPTVTEPPTAPVLPLRPYQWVYCDAGV